MAIFCHRCGVELRPDALFCQGCGAPATAPHVTDSTIKVSATPTRMKSRGKESLARSMWEVIKWPILLLVIFAVIHQFFYNADKEDAKKKEAERAALAVPLSSDEASADATIVHWVRSADHDDSGEYSIYFTKGEVYCGGVYYESGPDYAPELATFQVKDPVEQNVEKEKNGGPPDMFTTKGWHDFKDIHSARAYLRDRCLLLNMAEMIRASKLAPGQID